MKNLKKLAALLLVGVMALALLTACGGGGSSENAQAEVGVMSAINSKRSTPIANELKDDAKNFLGTVVDVNTGFFKFWNAVDIKKDEQTGVTTIKVVVKSEYTGTLLEDFFEKVNGKDKTVDIETVGKWTKVGVAAETVKGNTYVSVIVQIDPRG